MKYYLWVAHQEQGPYTIEQIRAAVDDGTINNRQTARTEDSADWKPLADIATLNPPKKQRAAPQAPHFLPPSPSPSPLPTVTATTQSLNPLKAYLAYIRKNTCYGVLRSIIEISFALSLIAVIGYVLVAGIASLAVEHGGYGILALFSGVLGVILLIAARQSALLLIDIADTLIHEHSKNK